MIGKSQFLKMKEDIQNINSEALILIKFYRKARFNEKIATEIRKTKP